jgi:hypothetical protein
VQAVTYLHHSEAIHHQSLMELLNDCELEGN